MSERFKNFFYGEFKCSGCESELQKWCMCVGEEEDINGDEWRCFCKACWQKIESKSDKEIYSEYGIADYADWVG